MTPIGGLSRLHQISMCAHDIERAVRFYRDTLGLPFLFTAPPRLAFFDCDGVLVDTERLAVRVDVQVLAQLGWVITEAEVVERFVGLYAIQVLVQLSDREMKGPRTVLPFARQGELAATVLYFEPV